MKKSRIAKISLMGASITALAATLTTSTYAWYVSNKTANVEAVSGSTAASGAGSSISLSTSGKVTDYHKTITLTNKTTGLNPVVRTGDTIASDGTTSAVYKSLSTSNELSTVNTEGSYYYEYKFYIKADADCTVRPTITVTNTTPTLPTQINYSGGYTKVAAAASAPAWAANTYYSYNAGTYTVTASQPTEWATTYTNYYTASENKVTGAAPGADFYVNALNALHMSLGMQTGAEYTSSQTTYSGTSSVTETAAPVSPVTNYMVLTALESTQLPSGASEATAGAEDYYEEITGYTLPSGANTVYTSSASTMNTTFDLDANVPCMMVYHLWLDGADDQCFNACAGQTFSVAFDFTVTA